MTPAVTDTGPSIHLDEIDALHVLSAIDHVLLPQTVDDERAAGTVPPALGDIEYELVEADSAALDVELDLGETAALAVAADRSAVLLTDDLAARNAAAERGVEVHGSIGILVLADSRGVLSQSTAIDHMRALQAETSLFITDVVVERGIALLEESS